MCIETFDADASVGCFDQRVVGRLPGDAALKWSQARRSRRLAAEHAAVAKAAREFATPRIFRARLPRWAGQRELQDALGIGLRWPPEWNLSPRETALLGVLVARERATRDAMMCALYGDDPDPSCERILRVFVYKLRRKLAPHGFTIMTRWGAGVAIPAEQRARLRELASR